MSFDVWNFCITVFIINVVYTKHVPISHKHHKKLLLRPSKRVEIPHPLKSNEYIESQSYRRQEVIHALNDDNKIISTSDDDDIESLGTTIDATGNSVKKNKTIKEIIPRTSNLRAKITNTYTKDIIAKIKEIQDKIFKRTGSKELEEKLKQMSPLGLPEIKFPLTEVLPNMNISHTRVESLSSSQTNKSLSEDTVMARAREALKNEMKLSDGSKQPERRKIIPEEVVDKILEKFQQLRQEAKHMALLETQHNEKDNNIVPAREDASSMKSAGGNNPYASIGPARENAEIKNRTQSGTDVTPVGLERQSAGIQPPDPPAQVPGTEPLNIANLQFPMNSVSDNQNKNSLPANTPTGQKNIPGIPLMFIKNGQMLVPVFDNSQSSPQSSNSNPMTITGNGLAQLNSNLGVALPSLPNNVIPMSSLQQPITSSFMNTPTQPPPKQLLNLPNMNLNQNGDSNFFDSMKNQQVNQANLQAMLLGMLSKATNNYSPAPTFNQGGLSRCGISGEPCVPPTSNMNTQPLMQAPQPEQQQYPVDNNENVPSTTQLINSIMTNSPGFSQLAAAAKLISDFNHNKPLTGDQRSFNNVPMFPTRPSMLPDENSPINNGNQGNMESSNPANIQFAMQQNLASDNPNNEVPLPITKQEQQPLDLQKTIMQLNQPPKLGSLPLSNSPYDGGGSDLIKQDKTIAERQDSPYFNGKHIETNDISDPPQEPMSQMEAPKFNSEDRSMNNMANTQDPDELLEIAKMKTLQGNMPAPEEQVANPVANVDENGMDPSHMTPENGNTERGLINTLNGVDPSNLLDKLHGAQLKADLMGAGDPRWFSPTYKDSMQRDKTRYGGSPDDLLEMLRKQNGQMFHKGFEQDRGDNLYRSHFQEENARMREKVPYRIDPSLADEIPDNDGVSQHFDVQNKDLVDNRNNNNLLNKDNFISSHGPISVLSDGLVQYKHGRMSMDSSSIVNSFLQDQQTFRNEIAHPRNGTNGTKPIVRATISKTFPEDNIELRINGRKISTKTVPRSKILNGTYYKIQGKTISSKSPIKVELSHGSNKRKVINIVTQGRYNVTDDTRRKKRTKIVRPFELNKRKMSRKAFSNK